MYTRSFFFFFLIIQKLCLQPLLFSTTRTCKFVILRTEQRAAEVQPSFVIKFMRQCTVCPIYLFNSFNYPALSAFEDQSIISYLKQKLACVHQGHQPLLYFLFFLSSFALLSLVQTKSGSPTLTSCFKITLIVLIQWETKKKIIWEGLV